MKYRKSTRVKRRMPENGLDCCAWLACVSHKLVDGCSTAASKANESSDFPTPSSVHFWFIVELGCILVWLGTTPSWPSASRCCRTGATQVFVSTRAGSPAKGIATTRKTPRLHPPSARRFRHPLRDIAGPSSAERPAANQLLPSAIRGHHEVRASKVAVKLKYSTARLETS